MVEQGERPAPISAQDQLTLDILHGAPVPKTLEDARELQRSLGKGPKNKVARNKGRRSSGNEGPQRGFIAIDGAPVQGLNIPPPRCRNKAVKPGHDIHSMAEPPVEVAETVDAVTLGKALRPGWRRHAMERQGKQAAAEEASLALRRIPPPVHHQRSIRPEIRSGAAKHPSDIYFVGL